MRRGAWRSEFCKYRSQALGMALWWVMAWAAAGAEPQYGGTVVIGATGGMAPLNPVITYATISVNLFDLLFDRFL